jgi:hypothetical protein
MTNALAISATELARSAEDRKEQRAELDRQFKEMSEVMVREQGLLNHSQAALLLDITPARVTELVNLGKFTRYNFLGRTYVSAKELRDRRAEDVKAGRPKRGIIEKVVVGVKAALQTDSLQAKQGGYNGPGERARLKRKKK